MSEITIHHGDSRSCDALNRRVGAPVTGLTERHQVLKIVRSDVVGEQAKRHDVVHVHSGGAAVLASGAVASPCLALLGRPVRAAMMHRAPLELRVQLADASPVSARALAIESASGRPLARRSSQRAATPYAGSRRVRDLAGRHRGVLTGWGAVLPTAVLGPRGRNRKPIATMSATEENGSAAVRESDRG